MSELSRRVIEHEDTNWFTKHIDSEQDEMATALAHEVEAAESRALAAEKERDRAAAELGAICVAATIRPGEDFCAVYGAATEAVKSILAERDALAERVKVLEAAVRAGIAWSDAVEQGFASKIRPDIARALFNRAAREAMPEPPFGAALTPPPDAKGSREVESWHLPREQAAQDGKHVVVIEEPTAPPPPSQSPPDEAPKGTP